MGNVEFNNLQIIPAQCGIEVLLSYKFGCKACTLKPYMIFQSSNIKNRGVLPFESNCTFNRNYLSCNGEPYKLEQQGESKYCSIYVPSRNRTLAENFEFEFLGNLDFSKSISGMETT